MARGDVVFAPDGERIELVDIGTELILDHPLVRVWDVALEAGGRHSWHLHGNPYVVLSVVGSTGRMDWLDGSPSREISEYSGGAVFRPVSPVHRLTNTGDAFYRNRLVELKHLGELVPTGPVDVGAGARSVHGVRPPGAADPGDGRVPILADAHVRVWTVTLAGGDTVHVDRIDVPHVVAECDGELEGAALLSSVRVAERGDLDLENTAAHPRMWFIIALDYLKEDAR
ncbi:hypothetical protein [Microbacterium radiodurans]|uniref:Cupin domain-containing protein n=1 Tax=Microbacterium radiodurans TaxID=661398 RepID=A0A5J5IPT7_9MICO|nr:hypothetical protein [Microbacterium radiodurans]KAA9085446.1 hypothetical protein F6B42_13380 [Microbacterium radiodurans]